MATLSDAVVQTERALLGSVLLDNSLWTQTESLSVEDFSFDWNRRIYGRMAVMFEEQRPVDNVTLTLELAQSNQLAACGDAVYITSLLDQGLSVNFGAYVRQVREAAQERRYSRLCEHLVDASEPDARLGIIQRCRICLPAAQTGRSGAGYFIPTMT